MDVNNLLKAAEYLKPANPKIADEILRVAQNLSGLDLNQQTQPNQTPVVSDASTVDPTNLNPNVKNYGNVDGGSPAEPSVDTHRISFDFNVPPGYSKTELLNHAMEAFNNHPGIRDNKIEVTGYSFKQ